MARNLALFDLDNTLLLGDSDYSWGEFLVQEGLVDAQSYFEKNRAFHEDYKAGHLDMNAFFAFSLQPLIDHGLETLRALRPKFMATVVEPMIAPGAARLLEQHATDTRVIITATSSFITQPIAQHFGVDALIATDPEIRDGCATGRIAGTPCYQAGKITKLREWLQTTALGYDSSWFYSDSINDLPLLEWADHPYAVHPDDRLRAIAESRNWPILSLESD